MGIYMEDVSVNAIKTENDLRAEAVLLWNFAEHVVDFDGGECAIKLNEASADKIDVTEACRLMEEVFDWLDANYEGEEDIMDVSERVRSTGILSEDKDNGHLSSNDMA